MFFGNYYPKTLDMYNGLSQSYYIKPKGRIHYYTKVGAGIMGLELHRDHFIF